MSNPAKGAALKKDGRIPLVLQGVFRDLLERKEAQRQAAERFFTGSWNAGMTLLREYRAHKDSLVSMTERANADERGALQPLHLPLPKIMEVFSKS